MPDEMENQIIYKLGGIERELISLRALINDDNATGRAAHKEIYKRLGKLEVDSAVTRVKVAIIIGASSTVGAVASLLTTWVQTLT